MTERDTTPVKVTLDRQRPYRVNDADRVAVWVGPGEATVPKWVAEHWGLTAASGKNEPGGSVTNEPGGSVTNEQPPVTVETVKEAPLKTVETVEVKDAPARSGVPKGKAK